MKFRKKYSLIIIALIKWSIISSPLTDGGGDIVAPLILNFNPSLITVNQGSSVGSKVIIDYEKSILDISLGYANRVNNSGFSLLYNNYLKNSINDISAAFGTKTQNFNFGASFKFLLKNGDVDFTFDVGANYLFNNDIYAGLLVNRILKTEIIRNIKPFEVDIFSGGKIPKLKSFYYDVIFGLLLFNDYSDPGFRGYLSLKKYFLKNPSLIIFGSSDVTYDYNSEINTDIDIAIGTKVKFERISLNIFCGSILNIESLYNKIYSEISIDTKRKSSNNRLDCNISVDNENNDIILTTKGVFETEKTSLKRWTVFIYNKSLKNENIVKTFSGGNIPLSSIIWDKRDSSGKLVDSGEYYVKIVVIDSLNRTIQSNRETITIIY